MHRNKIDKGKIGNIFRHSKQNTPFNGSNMHGTNSDEQITKHTEITTVSGFYFYYMYVNIRLLCTKIEIKKQNNYSNILNINNKICNLRFSFTP